jgi:hypothetical protein
MARVFLVQRPLRKNRDTGQLEEAFPNLDELASHYGTLVELLRPSAAPFNPDPVIKELHQKLADYCDDDYLLLAGNPMLIGMTVAIAADYNDGRVHCLQYSGRGGREGRYIPLRDVILFQPEDAT